MTMRSAMNKVERTGRATFRDNEPRKCAPQCVADVCLAHATDGFRKRKKLPAGAAVEPVEDEFLGVSLCMFWKMLRWQACAMRSV